MKKKLTMVSVWYKGQRKTIFAHLPVNEQGKTYMTDEVYDKFGIPHGTCVMIGG